MPKPIADARATPPPAYHLAVSRLAEPAPARNDAPQYGELKRRDRDGLERALRSLNIAVRFDVRAQMPEWRREGGGWERNTDRLEDSIRERIAEMFVMTGTSAPARFGTERWQTSLNAMLHTREIDPVREWIESLAPWDKRPRLATWLNEAFDAPDDELTRWVSRYIVLGAVERTYRPGSKLDVMPVLIGPQGAAKSSALALLFPDEHRDRWFSDALSLSADAKTRAEALQGRVLVEVSEMTGSTRAEIQALKGFLSRTDDGGVRLAWRRNPEPMPRRCILVGTANDVECLPNDPTGNRRFLGIEVEARQHGAAGVRAIVERDRAQLWAEALAMHRGGVAARLPEVLNAAQAIVNERFRSADVVLEDVLDRWLDEDIEARGPFDMATVAGGCKLVSTAGGVSKGDQMRLSGLLRARNFERRQVTPAGKPRARYWVRS